MACANRSTCATLPPPAGRCSSPPVVVFRVGVDNRRSRRAVEKLGAILVGSEPTEHGDHAVYELRR